MASVICLRACGLICQIVAICCVIPGIIVWTDLGLILLSIGIVVGIFGTCFLVAARQVRIAQLIEARRTARPQAVQVRYVIPEYGSNPPPPYGYMQNGASFPSPYTNVTLADGTAAPVFTFDVPPPAYETVVKENAS